MIAHSGGGGTNKALGPGPGICARTAACAIRCSASKSHRHRANRSGDRRNFHESFVLS